MRKIVFHILIITSFFTNAQSLDMSGGMNFNRFFSFQKEDGYLHKDFSESSTGFSCGLSISDVMMDTIPLKFSLFFDHYEGYFFCSNGSRSNYSHTEANVKRNDLSLVFYLLNFNIAEKVNLSFGIGASYRLSDITYGEQEFWNYISGASSVTIENDSVKINNDFSVAVAGSINVPFKIGNNMYLAPQYTVYMNLSSIFQNTEAAINNMRHRVEIAFIYELK